MPDNLREFKIEGGKSKRALLNFMSRVFNGLFGVATQDDVDNLNNNVYRVSKMLHDNIELIKGSSDHMSSFQKIVNSRVDKLVTEIKTVSLRNLKLLEAMEKQHVLELDYFANVSMQYSVPCGDNGNVSAYSSRDPWFDPRPGKSVI